MLKVWSLFALCFAAQHFSHLSCPSSVQTHTPQSIAGHTDISVSHLNSLRPFVAETCDGHETFDEIFPYLTLFWWINVSFNISAGELLRKPELPKSLELHRAKFPNSLSPTHDLGNHGKGFLTCSSGHFCSYESLLSSWTQDKWPQNPSELPSLEIMTGAGYSWCSCCQWPGSWFHIKDCVVACPSFSWKIKRH